MSPSLIEHGFWTQASIDVDCDPSTIATLREQWIVANNEKRKESTS
jgi:hypothetical protein